MLKTKTKNLENEVNKKTKDEDKIELMTQFMLDPTSSATKLLEKRREMYELQEALQRDKEKFIEKEEQFKKTEEELRNRDDEFHKKIVEYYKNSFEKKQTDNYNYNQKLDEEINLQKTLENSISNLDKKNEKLRGDLEKLKKIHESLKKYEEFLKNVKDKYPENFKDINDIISSYKTLKDTYENIKEEENTARKKKEEEKLTFQRNKKEYDSRINNIISQISQTQQELKV
jgi:chromosome segregation ATPase